MDVHEIIKKYLIDNKYDGLCCEECGCEISDLFPCGGEFHVDLCEAGYKIPCDPETCWNEGNCKWHISTKKALEE